MSLKKYEILEKIIIFLILMYQLFFSESFGNIPFFLEGLYLALDILFLCELNKFYINKAIFAYAIFISYAFITGLVISIYKSQFLTHISLGIEYFILFVLVYKISKKDKNINFIMKIIFISSVCFVFVALSRGIEIYGRLVINETSNANTLGNSCLLGLCSTVYFLINSRSKKKYILTLGIGFFGYGSLMSGSRKAIIIYSFFIILILIFSYKNLIKIHLKKSIFILIILIIILYFKKDNLIFFLENTVIYKRIMNDNLNKGRILLYEEGFKLFKMSPILGVGYQCYMYHNSLKLYAHSAYIEVLTGTGIIGFLFWVYFYISIFLQTIKKLIRSRKNLIYIWAFAWIICQIILDFSSTSLYNPGNMVILSAILSLNYKNSKIQNNLFKKNRKHN